ncbi:hypothetical protein MMC11_006733, partial [Xylographa trunciseda]|nr:hypothetical protein [Xylographa trunciseda]
SESESETDEEENAGERPLGNSTGSPIVSPTGTQPVNPVRVEVQVSKVDTTRRHPRERRAEENDPIIEEADDEMIEASGNDPFIQSGGGSGNLQGNETPMGEGYSRNFGTEGPVGGNVGLGGTPRPDSVAYPHLPDAGNQPGGLGGLGRIFSSHNNASRLANVGGSLLGAILGSSPSRDNASRPAAVSESSSGSLIGSTLTNGTALRPALNVSHISSNDAPQPAAASGSSSGALIGSSLSNSTALRPALKVSHISSRNSSPPPAVGGSSPADGLLSPAGVDGAAVVNGAAVIDRAAGSTGVDGSASGDRSRIRTTNTGTRPATVRKDVPADSPLRSANPNMTEEELMELDNIRSESMANQQRRKKNRGYKVWIERFGANILNALVVITLLWVAYHVLPAAPAGLRWASNRFHSQIAKLNQTGSLLHRPNTSLPLPTLNGINTDEYNDIMTRLTTMQKSHDSLGINTNEYNDIMARLTAMQNSYDSLSAPKPEPIGPSRVNYFSRGLGATIDPYLTSPTRKLTVRSRSWFGLSSYELRTPDPISAILPWEDIGDCWCAPPSGGKAQLTIQLPRKIVPTHLVIEHIPQGATLDIGSAPKEVELWVQIEDPETRVRVIDAAMAVPTLAEESLLAARTIPVYGAAAALDKSWVRIGRWEYDIFAADHVQSFAVPVELDHFQAAVDKVSVRVRKNWGMKDYTCLYRLKMHGLLAEKEGERDRTEGERREELLREERRVGRIRLEEVERVRDAKVRSSVRQEIEGDRTTTA